MRCGFCFWLTKHQIKKICNCSIQVRRRSSFMGEEPFPELYVWVGKKVGEDINFSNSEIRKLWCHFLFLLKEHRTKCCYWNLQIIGGFLNSRRVERQSNSKLFSCFLRPCGSVNLYPQHTLTNLRHQRTKHGTLIFFRVNATVARFSQMRLKESQLVFYSQISVKG